MMKQRLLFVVLTAVTCFCLPSSPAFPAVPAGEKTIRVLTSTFPMYQLVRNVAAGRKDIQVSLMVPPQLGCPHDYVLTPGDMRKLSEADLLVINGLGMEDFLDAPLKQVNPSLKIIDSSMGIRDILRYRDERADASGDHHHHHDHHDHDANPHLFASPRMAARLVMNIAVGFAGMDPDGAALYLQNARAYADRMKRLAEDFESLGARLANRRIVTQHGVFDYLARDIGLEIVAFIQPHAGQEPSAAEILKLIDTIKRRKPGVIVTEPQYPDKIGRILAGETGISAIMLDPAATGPENASLDYVDAVMRSNLLILEKTLGRH